MSVGIREPKAHLSEYVGQAAAGAEIVVTNRGRPVARLTPFVAASDVERGIDEGWIEPSQRSQIASVERTTSTRRTLDVLTEDRE